MHVQPRGAGLVRFALWGRDRSTKRVDDPFQVLLARPQSFTFALERFQPVGGTDERFEARAREGVRAISPCLVDLPRHVGARRCYAGRLDQVCELNRRHVDQLRSIARARAHELDFAEAVAHDARAARADRHRDPDVGLHEIAQTTIRESLREAREHAVTLGCATGAPAERDARAIAQMRSQR